MPLAWHVHNLKSFKYAGDALDWNFGNGCRNA